MSQSTALAAGAAGCLDPRVVAWVPNPCWKTTTEKIAPRSVRAECVDGNKGLAPVVAEQLENWFHDHEQTADADLRAHLGATR
jgi:hypothetical protein